VYGIGRSPVEDEVHVAIDFEELSKQLLGFGAGNVVAITRSIPRVGPLEAGPCFGADAGNIIAGESMA
jgi:hypothetical protein